MPPFNVEAGKNAFELMKQIATLNSVVLALSGTFISKLVPNCKWMLIIIGLSWLCLTFSLLYSIYSMSSIVQCQVDDNNEWVTGNASSFGSRAKWLFFFGVVLLVVFAALNAINI